ncbi:hypothetical protein GGI43DRAFT_401545 [Trichoderma evansii]
MSPGEAQPYRPDEDERTNYYRGLRPTPKSIARASCTPWSSDGLRPFGFRRCGVIRNHEGIAKYTDDFPRSIINYQTFHGFVFTPFA